MVDYRYRVPSEKARAIRNALRDANQIQEQRDPGWHRSTIDPETLVAVTPGVTLRSGFRLLSFEWLDDFPNGRGITYAVPESTVTLPVDLPDDPADDPRPRDALTELGWVLVPTRQDDPVAWFARSLLIRELEEIGALGHLVWWHCHETCCDETEAQAQVANSSSQYPRLSPAGALDTPWEWKEEAPTDYRPLICCGADVVEVTFYSRYDRGRKQIIRHDDRHTLGDGQLDRSDVSIATGGAGYMI